MDKPVEFNPFVHPVFSVMLGRVPERFATITDPDAVVRMRVGDALEKVCRKQPGWFVPRVDQIFDELGPVVQPSMQWHVAQLLQHLRGELSDDQTAGATALLQHNLATSPDWIVRNMTMDVLTAWAADDPDLARWLDPQLVRLQRDPRRSVAKRAAAHLARVRSLP